MLKRCCCKPQNQARAARALFSASGAGNGSELRTWAEEADPPVGGPSPPGPSGWWSQPETNGWSPIWAIEILHTVYEMAGTGETSCFWFFGFPGRATKQPFLSFFLSVFLSFFLSFASSKAAAPPLGLQGLLLRRPHTFAWTKTTEPTSNSWSPRSPGVGASTSSTPSCKNQYPSDQGVALRLKDLTHSSQAPPKIRPLICVNLYALHILMVLCQSRLEAAC